MTSHNSKQNIGDTIKGDKIEGDKVMGDKIEHHHYPLPPLISKFLTTPPPNPIVFEGRENDLKAIHDKFFAGENLLLLVNGQGGIGKTSFAYKYWHQYSQEYCFLAFLYAKEGIYNILMSLSDNLNITFDERLSKSERLNLLIQGLVNLESPCLLVLDDVNDTLDLENNILALSKCSNFHILITSRLDKFDQVHKYHLQALPKEQALDVFKKLYESFDDTETNLFYNLFKVIDGNTLLITLFAKNLNHFNNHLKKHYPLVQLIKDLENSLIKLSKSTLINTTYNAFGAGLRKATIEEIILGMYDISELDNFPNEKKLLSIFSMLPPEHISFDILKELITNLENLDKELFHLTQKGWLEYNQSNSTFKCSPVIQEVIRNKNTEHVLVDCQVVVQKLNEKLSYESGVEHFKHISREDSNLYARFCNSITSNLEKVRGLAQLNESIETLSTYSFLYERWANYFKINNDLLQALTCFKEFYDFRKRILYKEPNNPNLKFTLSDACDKLGRTYLKLGELNSAHEIFTESLLLIKEVVTFSPKSFDPKNALAMAFENIGDTYSRMGDLDKALDSYNQFYFEIQQLYTQNQSDNRSKNNLGIACQKLGDIYLDKGGFQNALFYFKKYHKLAEEVYQNNSNDFRPKNNLAVANEKLGDTLYEMKQFKEASQYFNNDLRLTKELYLIEPENPVYKYGLGVVYDRLGEIQLKLEHFDKSLRLFLRSHVLMKQLYEADNENIDFQFGYATSFEKLGTAFSRLNNQCKTEECYSKELELFEKFHSNRADNIDIKEGLANANLQLGLFHKNQGDLITAKSFFIESKQLFNELIKKSPEHSKFKTQLVSVEKNLSEIL